MCEQDLGSTMALADFQVGVDNVIFSVDSAHSRLLVLLSKRMSPPAQGQWSLPGTFVRVGETLEQSAYRVLSEKIRVNNLYLEQLYSFDDTLRPDWNTHLAESQLRTARMSRYLSVSYFALVRFDAAELIGISEARAAWFPIKETLGLEVELAFNHEKIVRYGYGRLQNKVTYSPLAFDVLPDQFTLSDLFQFYSIILGPDFTDYSNFRTRLLKLGFLRDTGQKVQRGAGRPAALYEFDAGAFLPFKDKPLVFV